MDLLLTENKNQHSYSSKTNKKTTTTEDSSFTDLLSESLNDETDTTEDTESEHKEETVSWLKSLLGGGNKNNETSPSNSKQKTKVEIDDDIVVIGREARLTALIILVVS